MSINENQDLIKQVSDDLTRKLQSNTNFDGFELFTFMRDHTLTRYANSVIHQPMSSKGIWANIKVNSGKKVISTKATIDDESINLIIESLEKSINKASEVPHFKGYAKSTSTKNINATGKLWNEAERAEVVDRVVNIGYEIDPRVLFYGKVETLGFHFVVSNSNEISKSHSITYNDFKVMGLLEENGDRGYGREVESARDPTTINVEELTKSATKIAVDTLHAQKVDPGEFTTILRPQALAELARYTVFDLESSAFHQGNSPFTDRLGEQLFSEKLNITEEPFNEDMIFASPIDSEGIERQKLDIIENGIPKHVFYDLLNASEFLDEEVSNGFAVLPYSEYLWGGPDAMAMSVKPGDSTEEQMIEDTRRGLLVQTFWYSNTVNATKGIITGLTRDGLYLVEDGEIKHAVKNLRYTDSYLSFFKNIDAIGKDTSQLVADYNGSNIIPSMKL
ncbi:MAG: TldD/PmbA family protein, partial [Candidatus Heimdallarchaeota archaeon]|nr:TldD/PmbA family protein [Candidatus Heimdallarchaeota archaeon]